MLTFLMLSATPGDPATRILIARGQESITGAQVMAMRAELGLDQPLPVRLWDYLTGLLRGDLGTSWSSGRPVAEELFERLPATIRLTVVALVIAVVLSLLLGLAAAWGARRFADRATRVFSLVFLVVPSFLLAIVTLDLVVVRWGHGRVIADGSWGTVLLPALILAVGPAASWSRVLRAGLLEARGAPHLGVSRARGVSGSRRLLVHELPNALPPYVTLVGMEIALLLGGAAIIESVFSWPGVGRFTVQAVEGRDMPVVVGFTIIAIALYVAASLVVDGVNALLDPRRKELR